MLPESIEKNMSNETLLTGKKAENGIKESLFLFTLYICVTIAILTLMTLIYDVLSTGIPDSPFRHAITPFAPAGL